MSFLPMPDSSLRNASTLYRLHHRWLHAWLWRKLGCTHQAADFAHDVFLKVLLIPALDDIHEPRAYLTRIAHGLVVNHWRRREIERAYLEALAAMPEHQVPSVEQRYLALEALYEIDAMLATMPAKVRQAFLLSQLDGMKYADIALQLGVSERMVKKYMAQAMLACMSFLP